MISFLITTTFFFLFLSFIWTRKDWFNFTIKFVFFGCGVWGIVLSLIQLGFVFKR
jgi:hypothetical protein